MITLRILRVRRSGKRHPSVAASQTGPFLRPISSITGRNRSEPDDAEAGHGADGPTVLQVLVMLLEAPIGFPTHALGLRREVVSLEGAAPGVAHRFLILSARSRSRRTAAPWWRRAPGRGTGDSGTSARRRSSGSPCRISGSAPLPAAAEPGGRCRRRGRSSTLTDASLLIRVGSAAARRPLCDQPDRSRSPGPIATTSASCSGLPRAGLAGADRRDRCRGRSRTSACRL